MRQRRSPEVMKLSLGQLRDIVEGIRNILWLDIEPHRDFYNPDKTWDWETLEYVAGTLEDAGLRPARKDFE
jgi:hypothetical protein